jgi:hypothetical protein
MIVFQGVWVKNKSKDIEKMMNISFHSIRILDEGGFGQVVLAKVSRSTDLTNYVSLRS